MEAFNWGSDNTEPFLRMYAISDVIEIGICRARKAPKGWVTVQRLMKLVYIKLIEIIYFRANQFVAWVNRVF